jgi:alkylation response protein AidB-like acyl-CoA dehydrogenase
MGYSADIGIEHMNLTYSEEQNLFRESIERFVGNTYANRARATAVEKTDGFDPSVWKQFADLGWLSLPLPETAGGLGGDAVDTGIVMEAFGRGLVSEPYISAVVLAGSLLAKLSPAEQTTNLLSRVGDGSLIVTLAHDEGRTFSLLPVSTRATKEVDGWRLDGNKRFVLDAEVADMLLVTARIAGNSGDAGGVGVFAVPSNADGLVLKTFPRLGGGGGARVELRSVPLSSGALISGDDALPQVEAAIDAAAAAMCSEAVGMMQALLDKSVTYTKMRVQFGQPLSANQVVRHRLSDMAIACQEARSLALRAALLVKGDAVARGCAVSGAKAKIGRSARLVAEHAVQLHGGMGVTDELDIGRYLKRIIAFDTIFGDASYHLRRRATLSETRLSA